MPFSNSKGKSTEEELGRLATQQVLTFVATTMFANKFTALVS